MPGNKCVFNCCPNRIKNCLQPGILFFSFDDVPPSVSKQWTKIVAREKCLPNFTPEKCSKICSEHFAPYEISPSKTLYSTAIPTINIGPYSDTVVIEDAEKVTRLESSVICGKEKLSSKPITSPNNDVICVIENQICLEPKQVADNVDIEDQIQWSLVGTSKHFKGLLHTRDQKALEVSTVRPSQTELQNKYYVDDDVILIEDNVEHNNYENEANNDLKNQFSHFNKTYYSGINTKKRILDVNKDIQKQEHLTKSPIHIGIRIQYESSAPKKVHNEKETEIVTEFKDQFSKFIKKYKREPVKKPSKIEFREAATTQHATAPQQPLPIPTAITEQFQTITDRKKTVPSTNSTVKLKTSTVKQAIATAQEYATAPQKPLSITGTIMKQSHSITHKTVSSSNTTEQLEPTAAKHVETTTQEPVPVQLLKTSQLISTTQHIFTPGITIASQNSPQIQSPPISKGENTLTLKLLTPTPSSGTQLSVVCVRENNIQTYYLCNLLPSRVIESDSPSKEKVTQQHVLVYNEQDNDNLQPVIVKTESIIDD